MSSVTFLTLYVSIMTLVMKQPSGSLCLWPKCFKINAFRDSFRSPVGIDFRDESPLSALVLCEGRRYELPFTLTISTSVKHHFPVLVVAIIRVRRIRSGRQPKLRCRCLLSDSE